MTDCVEKLRSAFVALSHDQQSPEDLPDVASRALAHGVDVPALRELAALGRQDPREARDLFLLAMAQLGIEPPTRWDAVRSWARQIVNGTIEPYEGARLIWWQGWEALGRPDELTPFVGLASEWEDDPGRRAAYDDDIVSAARRLLAPPA
ncbi:MAG: hypothetical protein BGO38_14355 [Cellulomonas sp. 73-145]|uniref:hypothetical protein n=1 Tax=Cellulomonas sp. 73-145 TaxID=1895739 RepID=UPI00092B93CF|nr:hypothetical protein [Cellulomonas sp. 73-145]MBN9326958.1 hypothetical protein [Cellulomonas sp.]OJV58603.1 MAG: hypothetical protein BGO38_14355 [Cellulomonas sp. 73-145]